MSDRQPPRQPPVLSPAGQQARRTYFASLLSLGFTLLKLHKLDDHGGCNGYAMSWTGGTAYGVVKVGPGETKKVVVTR